MISMYALLREDAPKHINQQNVKLLTGIDAVQVKELKDDEIGVLVMFGFPVPVRKRTSKARNSLRERQISKNVVYLHGAYFEEPVQPILEQFIRTMNQVELKAGKTKFTY